MANSTFLPLGITDYLTAANPYPCPNYMAENYCNYFPGFELLSDYLPLENQTINEDSTSSFTSCTTISQTPVLFQQEMTSTGSGGSANCIDGMPMNNIPMPAKSKREINRRAKTNEGQTVAFRTRTELESLDDGYKWRKYGKKKVKANPNPRHYYKCSSFGCEVKKRVERDRSDTSYLITTYYGRHNHESPYVIHYDESPIPFAVPFGRTTQESQPPSP